jgi:hypothetical protein
MEKEMLELTTGPEDIMSVRAGMMIALAETVDKVRNEAAQDMLLYAMDCLLFTINPPRGELVSIKKDAIPDTPDDAA